MPLNKAFAALKGAPRTLSLTMKVIVTFLVIITAAMIAMGMISYYQSKSYIDRQNVQYAGNVATNVSNEMNRYVEEMNRISKILLGNADVQRYIEESQSPDYSPLQRLNDYNEMTSLVISFTSVRDNMIINFYDRDMEFFFSGPHRFLNFESSVKLRDNPWIRENRGSIDARDLYIVPPNRIDRGLPVQLFGVIRSLIPIDDNIPVGYITITSDTQILQNILDENRLFSKDEMQIEIVGPDGTVLLDSNGETEGRTYELAESPAQVITHRSDVTDWTTVITVRGNFKNALLDARSLRNHLLLLTSLVLVGSLLLVVLLSSHVLRPIRKMIQSMRIVRKGNFDIELSEEGLDYEVKQLYGGFNMMVSEIKKLIQKIYNDQIVLKSAQMDALQFQINPHFLYNTLQTMEALGEVRDVPEIQTIAQSLGRLFQYNIRGNHIVTFREELDHVGTYFEIEKIRFRDKLDYSFRVEPELLEKCRVLKFILQPIVENCVLHGFRNLGRAGVITIEAEEKDGFLEIRVADNGVGIEAGKLHYLNAKLREISANRGGGATNEWVGIFNVHKRLVNYYGAPCGLRIDSAGNKGTVVVLTQPIAEI
ncbi:sensor histidine kinase [Cohnella cellulosilytica]|uniref:Sensor histidine kinase n=1 Tax=Cohnella cellulosilytica TaxID=986710 RepID=A0ABW2FAN0_9BACL